MSSKYRAEGKTLNYLNSTGSTLAVDVPVVVGDCIGVPVADIPDGETGVVAIVGEFKQMPKVAGVALVAGARLDFDASSGDNGAFTAGLTAASGDVEDCAICAIPAASGDTTVTVILNNPGTLN